MSNQNFNKGYILEKDEQRNIEEDVAKKSEKEVVIYTMPQKFAEFRKPGIDKTQKAGIFILVGGVLTLLFLFTALYYYFFVYKAPVKEVQEQTPTIIEKKEEVKEEVKEEIPEQTEEVLATSTPEESATSTEVMEEATTTTSQVPEEVLEEPKELKAAMDSDGDNLSDMEEVLLGTDIKIQDSDGDGYSDFAEIGNLFNPAGNGKISDNKNLSKYYNNAYNYALLYPNLWVVKNTTGDDSVVFDVGNNQFVQAMVQPNPDKLSLIDWYKEQFSDTASNPMQTFKNGWTGIFSDDGLVAYILHPKSGNIIIMTYNVGVDYTLYYKNIFNMMINTLEAFK